MQVTGSKTTESKFMKTNMTGTCRSENERNTTKPHLKDDERIRRLLKYNNDLEEQIDTIQLNESFLESKLEELESILSTSDFIEICSLARLTELTLICAGNYANNNLIAEVGDLIFNPRLILIHIKGKTFPVIKERHMRLSEQFKDKGGTEPSSVIEWLKFNTIVETVKKPILPHLLDLLEQHGCSGEYLDAFRTQMNKIVELVSVLSISRIPGETTIKDWKSSLGKNDKMMIDDLFYQTDTTVFHDLGKKIRHAYEMDHAVGF